MTPVQQIEIRSTRREEMIDITARAMLPEVPLTLTPASHPYTVDGLEVHAVVDGRAVEILECGLAAPRILAAAGLSSAMPWRGCSTPR